MKSLAILTAAAAMITAPALYAQRMHDNANHGNKEHGLSPGHAMPMENGVSIEAAWARASVGKNGAAYATLINRGHQGDRLIATKSPAARRAEIHTHFMEGNVMKMRRVKYGIALEPGKTVKMMPGGFHVMLMGLHGKLVKGETFPITFVFEKAGEIRVPVRIGDVGAMNPHGSRMNHGDHKH